MTPISSPTDRPDPDGFTLIELLVVMAVMSLLATVAVVSLRDQPGFVDRSRKTGEIIASLNAARDSAMRTGKPVSVDAGALAEAKLDPQDGVGGKDAIVFYADGSSNGGVIRWGERPLIAVDWLTGEVRRAR